MRALGHVIVIGVNVAGHEVALHGLVLQRIYHL